MIPWLIISSCASMFIYNHNYYVYSIFMRWFSSFTTVSLVFTAQFSWCACSGSPHNACISTSCERSELPSLSNCPRCLYIIGERSEPPLSVELSELSLYLYIYIYIFIYIFQAVRRARAVNALRANVGPAGWGSTVNIIALKTATLVLSCS